MLTIQFTIKTNILLRYALILFEDLVNIKFQLLKSTVKHNIYKNTYLNNTKYAPLKALYHLFFLSIKFRFSTMISATKFFTHTLIEPQLTI